MAFAPISSYDLEDFNLRHWNLARESTWILYDSECEWPHAHECHWHCPIKGISSSFRMVLCARGELYEYEPSNCLQGQRCHKSRNSMKQRGADSTMGFRFLEFSELSLASSKLIYPLAQLTGKVGVWGIKSTVVWKQKDVMDILTYAG